VVPCYNEDQMLEHTSKVLSDLLSNMIAKGFISSESFCCFVNDGSSDDTWGMIQKLCSENKLFRAISLSRNFGHQSAILAGLMSVKDTVDVTVTIDADLQDDVNVIYQFIEKYAQGCDIVYGVRDDRTSDSFLKKHTAQLFYKIQKLIGIGIVNNHADYRLMSSRAVDALEEYGERNLFLRGIIPMLGFKTTRVYYKRKERLAGLTKYTPLKMISLACNGIISFSILPIRLVGALGLLVFTFSFLASIYFLYLKFFTDKAIHGWTTLVLSIYFLGAVQLISIAILGEYIGKIYLETKRRPRYIIGDKIL